MLLTLIMEQAGSLLLTQILWEKLEAEVTKLQITRAVHSRIVLVTLSVLTFHRWPRLHLVKPGGGFSQPPDSKDGLLPLQMLLL